MLKALLTFILMVLVLFLFYSVYANAPLGFSDSAQATLSSYLKVTLSAIALILGIVCGAVHRLWARRKGKINLEAVKTALQSAEVWRSLLLAPLVFAGAYAAAQEQPDFVLAFVVAFQSGFFCDTVLQERTTQAP